jgi:hypothetical protein
MEPHTIVDDDGREVATVLGLYSARHRNADLILKAVNHLTREVLQPPPPDLDLVGNLDGSDEPYDAIGLSTGPGGQL